MSETTRKDWDRVLEMPISEFLGVVMYHNKKMEEEKKAIDKMRNKRSY